MLYTVTVEEDENGDLILPLGEEFMRDNGWLAGDTIVWKLADGYAIMTNASAESRKHDESNNSD